LWLDTFSFDTGKWIVKFDEASETIAVQFLDKTMHMHWHCHCYYHLV